MLNMCSLGTLVSIHSKLLLLKTCFFFFFNLLALEKWRGVLS